MDDMSVTMRKVEFWPVDVPITNPFVVATGTRTIAGNVLLRITLSNGAQGYGETAPFPEVGGETRESCLTALRQLCKAVLGRSTAGYKEVGRLLSEQALTHPAARCGLETAVIDAYCRTSNIPMWQLWGGTEVQAREADITIPITDLDTPLLLASDPITGGYRYKGPHLQPWSGSGLDMKAELSPNVTTIE